VFSGLETMPQKYDSTKYPEAFHALFRFLTDEWDFSETRNDETDFSYINEFKKNDVCFHFNFDIRDDAFYFYFMKGPNTSFSSDNEN
jgi:hypothetical protein